MFGCLGHRGVGLVVVFAGILGACGPGAESPPVELRVTLKSALEGPFSWVRSPDDAAAGGYLPDTGLETGW